MSTCTRQIGSGWRRTARGACPAAALTLVFLLLSYGPGSPFVAPVAASGSTRPPDLRSPTANAVTTTTVPVTFTLPDTPEAGTVELDFEGGSDYSLTLDITTSGTHSLNVDPANPAGTSTVEHVSGGSSITPGVYTIVIEYQDQAGNPPAAASAAAVAVSACASGSYSTSGFAPCDAADPGDYVPGVEATIELPCNGGMYSTSAGSSGCLPTPAGFYTTSGASVPTPCPAGSYCPSQSAAPSPCPAGSFCPASSSAAAACPVGSFCGVQASVPTPCPGGTYNPEPSATSDSACLPVAAGSYAGSGAASALPCPAGSACATGASAPLLCSAGTYAPGGSAICISADPGSFVAGDGAFAEAQCLAGSFASNPGAVQCTLAPVGSYAPAGATSAIGCPAGTTTKAPGGSSCEPMVARLTKVKVTVLAGGRIALRLGASTPGTFLVTARIRARRYGSARTARPGATADLTLVPAHDVPATANAVSVVLTVSFTPTWGGRSATRRLTVRVSGAHGAAGRRHEPTRVA